MAIWPAPSGQFRFSLIWALCQTAVPEEQGADVRSSPSLTVIDKGNERHMPILVSRHLLRLRNIVPPI